MAEYGLLTGELFKQLGELLNNLGFAISDSLKAAGDWLGEIWRGMGY